MCIAYCFLTVYLVLFNERPDIIMSIIFYAKDVHFCSISPKRSAQVNLANHVISERVVRNADLLSQPVGRDRKVFACGAPKPGFESRLHELVFGVILVHQNTK